MSKSKFISLPKTSSKVDVESDIDTGLGVMHQYNFVKDFVLRWRSRY